MCGSGYNRGRDSTAFSSFHGAHLHLHLPVTKPCRQLAIKTARILVETSISSSRTAENVHGQRGGTAATHPARRAKPQHLSASRYSSGANASTPLRGTPLLSKTSSVHNKASHPGSATATRNYDPPEELWVSGDQVLRTMGGGYLLVTTLCTLSKAIPPTMAIESISLQLAGMKKNADPDDVL